MTDPAADIAVAERRATQARERLAESLQRLQAKMNPKVLARDAARSAADAGQNAATTGLDYARANPAPVAGAVAVTGLLLFRKRLVALVKRRKRPTVPAEAKAPAPALSHSDREVSR